MRKYVSIQNTDSEKNHWKFSNELNMDEKRRKGGKKSQHKYKLVRAKLVILICPERQLGKEKKEDRERELKTILS